jgi:hypothetical protein
VGAEEQLARGEAVVTDDHRLAAAEVETGDRVLVGHAAREAQGVHDGFFVAGVLPEAGAAERGA